MFIGLLSGAGCSLQKTQAVAWLEQQAQTVRWVEKARIAGVEKEIKVKLDTGATTTSINAEILGEFGEAVNDLAIVHPVQRSWRTVS